MARRQELAGTVHGRYIIHEDACHPESLRVALGAVKQRFPSAALHLVFQPQYPGGPDDIFQRNLPEAIAEGGVKTAHLLPMMDWNDERKPDPPFDQERLQRELTERGVKTFRGETLRDFIKSFPEETEPGDAIIVAWHTVNGQNMPVLIKALEQAVTSIHARPVD